MPDLPRTPYFHQATGVKGTGVKIGFSVGGSIFTPPSVWPCNKGHGPPLG